MNKSIRLSPKHGVNPTIPCCFICGEPKNEVALLGKLKDDKEAPMYTVIDYEPCDTCKAAMKQGIAFLGASRTPMTSDQPPIQNGLYPTGKLIVLTEEAASRIIADKEMLASTLKHRKAFMEDAVIDAIIAKSNQEEDSHE